MVWSRISSIVYKRKRRLAFWSWDLFQKATVSSSASQSCWFLSCFTVFCSTYTVPVCLSCVYFLSPCPYTPSITLIIMGKMLCYLSNLGTSMRWKFPLPFPPPNILHPWFTWLYLTSQKGDDHENVTVEDDAARTLTLKDFIQVFSHGWGGWDWQSWSLPKKKREKAVGSQQNYISNPKLFSVILKMTSW